MCEDGDGAGGDSDEDGWGQDAYGEEEDGIAEETKD